MPGERENVDENKFQDWFLIIFRQKCPLQGKRETAASLGSSK
jgi:hypothetical protein